MTDMPSRPALFSPAPSLSSSPSAILAEAIFIYYLLSAIGLKGRRHRLEGGVLSIKFIQQELRHRI